ncbi:MAG: hypothetical protein R3B70_41645 [Polyangiaceae bacterium]
MRRVIGIAAVGACLAIGCVLGSPEEPGCAEDAECDDGFVCRAGACVRELPFTPSIQDAGADGDAGGGGAGGGG